MKKLLLALAALAAASALAEPAPRFAAAKPVWPKWMALERNLFVGFAAHFDANEGERPLLRITGASDYRISLNGEHVGNYYLCEQVKVGKNRVNIKELATGEVDGGYLMELDDWFDEEFKFHSPVHNVPWQFKDPDVVTQAQFDYMYNYVKEFEEALIDHCTDPQI